MTVTLMDMETKDKQRIEVSTIEQANLIVEGVALGCVAIIHEEEMTTCTQQ